MAFENLLRNLRMKLERQERAVEETKKQIKELEDALAKK